MVLQLLGGILCVYALLVLGMYVFQRQLMYAPNKHIESPAFYGLGAFESLRMPSADGVALELWHTPAAPGLPLVVYFHGNAGHLGDRAGIYAALAEQGFGVLALSYRGYGKSEGEPSENGLYDDARAALRYATDILRQPPGRIIIFGESLGTGVSVQMATEFAIGALVLQSPYVSVSGRAAEIYPYVPVRWLIHDRYDSEAKIEGVKAPVLIFHGERDRTIPVAHGRRLYEKITAKKHAVYFPDVDHMDFDVRLLAQHVLEFARQHHLVGS